MTHYRYPPTLDVLDLSSDHPVPGGMTMRPEPGPDTDLVCAPTDSWPLDADSLDRIDAHGSLDGLTVEEVAHVFSEARRTLRPFGVFEASVPLDGYSVPPGHPVPRQGWYWETVETCLELADVSEDARGPLRLDDRDLRLAVADDSSAGGAVSALLRRLSEYDDRIYRLCDLPAVEGRLTVRLRKGPATRTVVVPERGDRTLPA